MNGAARFVFDIGRTRGTRRTLWSVAGAVFWYGTVALAIVLAPHVDRWLGFDLNIVAVVKWAPGLILLLIGTPVVAWTITRFLRTRGTPIPFNPPPVFVSDGLYNMVRNPMHAGWTLVIAGIGVLMESLALLAIFLPVFVIAHILYIKLIEEKELEQKFGQSYVEYKHRVPMFVPRVGKRGRTRFLTSRQTNTAPVVRKDR